MNARLQQTIGPYRILRLIDQGGQGSVFLGYDPRLQRHVAVKLYTLPHARPARRRLLKEARVIAGLHSSKVVAVYDLIDSHTHLAMVMEYVPGCTLETFLRGAQPSVDTVLTVTADVSMALAATHHAGVVHGDVKPANILITDRGGARLTDFGIAGAMAKLPVGGRPGALSAVSPEHYRGRPLDERSDLFSLGLVVYRMLCGEHPFAKQGRLDVERLCHGPAPSLTAADVRWDDAPPELLQLVGGLLRIDPAERPTMREVRRVLRHLRNARPLAASSSVLREAKAFFRPEANVDRSIDLPPGLNRRNTPRALLRRLGLRGPLSKASSHGLLAFGVSTSALLAGGWMWAIQPISVQVAEPRLSFDQAFGLPQELSPQWLAEELNAALRAQLGDLNLLDTQHRASVITGPDGAIGAASASIPSYTLALNCVEATCVMTISRQQADLQNSAQSVLVAGMNAVQWRQAVRQTTRRVIQASH
ncbi:MAG: serine/threonine-protein kinase [Pseudomonadota bacterium]